jgi:SAM-dependent methyltransferase
MAPLLDVRDVEWVDTDVTFGPRTTLICDAHDLPLSDGAFDAVVAQAVLEHVADPYRCVAEIYRVLKPDGLIYAETPFLQPMHGGVYDFTRFTYMGHRRLFRFFTEIKSGASSGPGSTLAVITWYFLLILVRTKRSRRAATVASFMLCWPFKYFDRWLLRNPAAFEVAPGFFFMGQRSERALSDRELVEEYGLQRLPGLEVRNPGIC